MTHIDNWKNKSVFKQQLERNLFELSSPSNYPVHWQLLLDFLKDISKLYNNDSKLRFLDCGSGCGALKALVERHYPNVNYFGCDYSQEAVNLAIDTFGFGNNWGFCVKDYKDLTYGFCDTLDIDILHQSALCDVLPNGDECFNKLLSLDVPTVISQKMKITNGPSEYKEYNVYGIDTYEYTHNEAEVLKIIKDNNYIITKRIGSSVGTSFLLNMGSE